MVNQDPKRNPVPEKNPTSPTDTTTSGATGVATKFDGMKVTFFAPFVVIAYPFVTYDLAFILIIHLLKNKSDNVISMKVTYFSCLQV
jgi:hypothetical protein